MSGSLLFTCFARTTGSQPSRTNREQKVKSRDSRSRQMAHRHVNRTRQLAAPVPTPVRPIMQTRPISEIETRRHGSRWSNHDRRRRHQDNRRAIHRNGMLRWTRRWGGETNRRRWDVDNPRRCNYASRRHRDPNAYAELNASVRRRESGGKQRGCQNNCFHTLVLTRRYVEPSGLPPDLLQFFFE